MIGLLGVAAVGIWVYRRLRSLTWDTVVTRAGQVTVAMGLADAVVHAVHSVSTTLSKGSEALMKTTATTKSYGTSNKGRKPYSRYKDEAWEYDDDDEFDKRYGPYGPYTH